MRQPSSASPAIAPSTSASAPRRPRSPRARCAWTGARASGCSRSSTSSREGPAVAERQVDFGQLDRYLAMRYGPGRLAASIAVKTLLPMRLLAQRAVAVDPADIVLLHPHAPGRRRHGRIVARLAELGLAVREEIMPQPRELFAERKLCEPRGGWAPVPRRWRL